MSLKSTSYVLDRKYGSHVRKLIMLIIADFSNDDGEAWPSIDTLAFKAECSRRAVQENLILLETAGEIAVHQNAGPRGCNLYRIIFRNYTPELKTFIPRNIARNGEGAAGAPVQPAADSAHGEGAYERRLGAPEPLGTVKEPLREREQPPTGTAPKNSPARSFSPDELCDLMDRVNGCRPEWKGLNFTSTERSTFLANLEALASITAEQWAIIPRYLSASHPQGSGAYLPKSRERLLRDITDVLTHALGWERKQPRPKKLQTPATEPSSHEPDMTPDEIKAFFKPVQQKAQAAPEH